MDIAEWRKDVRVAAKQYLPSLLTHDGTHLHNIYSAFRAKEQALCDDSIPCEHNGVTYSGCEWMHQVRWALQDLKSHEIVNNGPTSYWSLA